MGPAYRGQPLLALAVLLGGWALARAALWQSPFETAAGLVGTLMAQAVRAEPAASAASVEAHRGLLSRDFALPGRLAEPAAPAPAPAPIAAPGSPRLLGGHNLILVAALSGLPVTREWAALRGPAGSGPVRAAPLLGLQPVPAAAGRPGQKRWSVDGWLLLRGAGAVAAASATYGTSQAGTVFRYRLLPGNPHRPLAYFRSSKALSGRGEAELAVGLAGSPVPALPVVAAAELRLREAEGALALSPAAFAYSELPRVNLPGGLRGEAYLQAGYVGGDFATFFADGQLRLERPLARLGPGELSAGAGAWGGAQQGAARLDIGPSASLSLTAAEPSVRLSTDWRFRVAGKAAPRSGPAMTISASF